MNSSHYLGKRFTVISVSVLLAVLAIGPIQVLEGGQLGSVRWAVYTDPRFGFSVEYPAGWYVYPRDDHPDYVGGTLVFSEAGLDSTVEPQIGARIEIGFYLVEYDPSQALAEWSQAYSEAISAFAPRDVRVQSVSQIRVGGVEAFREEGASPLTQYTYVNIPHQRIVWFVWMNRMGGEYGTLFDHVVGSLRFSENTPGTLQEVYGQSFQPIPLRGSLGGEGTNAGQSYPAPLGISADYRVPVRAPWTRYILCGNINAPVCDGTHSGSAAKAIDISLPQNTSVVNSATSRTNSAGWNPYGYGNLVTMYDWRNNYVAYYAHLSSFNWSNLFPPEGWVSQGIEIGRSGCTGNCGGPHLHFHVRTTGWVAVNLAGMPHLTLYSSYPNCGHSTCPGSFQCTCGRVY